MSEAGMILLSVVLPSVIAGLAAVFGAGGVIKYMLEKKDKKKNEEIADIIEDKTKPIVEDLAKLDDEFIGFKNNFESYKTEAEIEKMNNMRSKILRFANDLVENDKKNISKEYFNDMMIRCDKYEDYCEIHPEYENSLANDSIEIIREEHKKFLRGVR